MLIAHRRARALLCCALPWVLAGCAGPAARPPATAPGYTVLQMNLCLSGRATCADRAVVEEAVARIRETRPDAVTLNEACRGDVARIAARTGYHRRFTRVLYGSARLRCVRPGGRGLFGDAVLTRAAVERAEAGDFEGQAGPERRRWLCVATRAAVDVCTAHLNTRSAVEVAGNEAQCAELATLLARRAAGPGSVVFAGDVNRRGPCAPDGLWIRTDASAERAPGFQHVYGATALRAPAAQVLPAAHTDHDVLVVRARLTAPSRR